MVGGFKVGRLVGGISLCRVFRFISMVLLRVLGFFEVVVIVVVVVVVRKRKESEVGGYFFGRESWRELRFVLFLRRFWVGFGFFGWEVFLILCWSS